MLAFLQKIGKSLMFPIATLPAAALLVRFGQEDMLNLPVIAAAGDGILGNLPIIFAIGIAMGFAFDTSGGAALAGAIAYLVLTNGLKAYDETINMSVFGGIISGVIAGLLYNKFYNVKFPEWLSFFGGRRFVPIITSIIMTALVFVFGVVWPPVQGVIDSLGDWVLGAGGLGVGVYGLLNRLLIPVGLHHVINTIVWFDFGTFTNAAGEVAHGEINRFLKGDPTAGTFLAGFFPIMMFGLPSACLAMYFAAKKEKRAAVGGMLLSIALTAFITGVTEPIEFTFMFLSPVLYGVHAVLTGISLYITESLGILHGFGFSAGLIDYLLNFGIATKPVLLFGVGLVFAVIYFFVFYFLIKALNLKTPGREDDEDEEAELSGSADEVLDTKAFYMIEGLGGPSNINEVDYCATRLRMSLKDTTVIDEALLKRYGARGVMRMNKTAAQVVIGPSVEFLGDAIRGRLKQGHPPLKNEAVMSTEEEQNTSLNGALNVAMPATGELLPLTAVPDQVFSTGMMGPGFAINPTDGVFVSPVNGEIAMVFPTKHAIGLMAEDGTEILIHVGLDTVKLNGEGFEVLVEQGQSVKKGDLLLKVDLQSVSAAAPSIVTPVVFTNLQGKEIKVKQSGNLRNGDAINIEIN
ncbi:N-acetylglucosamine-specific PTS transporter subunit IIBC [Bacillus ndiopicus]|uniref:N-acetylglucosamine-specific PTS transporter subunit IIBC n=1 Tax=Bacillus ndiopicus TaxID=1347368 RepID=UPI0005A5EFEB|nr:N-acetylglucosamine-specific PTS transporter subunit IIBC [Bacillus ndiopicus]